MNEHLTHAERGRVALHSRDADPSSSVARARRQRSVLASCRALPGRRDDVADLLGRLVEWSRTQRGTLYCTAPMADVTDSHHFTVFQVVVDDLALREQAEAPMTRYLLGLLRPLLVDSVLETTTLRRF
jgi:quinol monooxygenase YgiN